MGLAGHELNPSVGAVTCCKVVELLNEIEFKFDFGVREVGEQLVTVQQVELLVTRGVVIVAAVSERGAVEFKFVDARVWASDACALVFSFDVAQLLAGVVRQLAGLLVVDLVDERDHVERTLGLLGFCELLTDVPLDVESSAK